MPPAMRGYPSPAPAPAPSPLKPPPGLTDLEMRAWQQKNELELRAQEARAKMEELNKRRAEQEMKKAKYQQWLADNDAPPGDDGVQVTDQGIMRTAEYKPTSWNDAPDPPMGTQSMAPSYWLPDMMSPDFATYAARQSVRVKVEDGVLQPSIGFDKGGTFHPVRHFHSGSAYERYRRALPPGYMGHIPYDATPVTGGKIGVIEKKHPVLYSTVRPATGHVVADIMDDVHDQSWAAEGDAGPS